MKAYGANAASVCGELLFPELLHQPGPAQRRPVREHHGRSHPPSDTSVAGAFIYDNIPLRAPLLASEEEHEPIHRVDLLRRMLLHQQAGEEEEDHAWPVSGEPCLHRAARRRGGIKKEGPPVVTFPFDAPRGIYDPHFTYLAYRTLRTLFCLGNPCIREAQDEPPSQEAQDREHAEQAQIGEQVEKQLSSPSISPSSAAHVAVPSTALTTPSRVKKQGRHAHVHCILSLHTVGITCFADRYPEERKKDWFSLRRPEPRHDASCKLWQAAGQCFHIL